MKYKGTATVLVIGVGMEARALIQYKDVVLPV